MLTEAQVAHYHEAGYVVPEFRLSEDALVEIVAAPKQRRGLRPYPARPGGVRCRTGPA